MFIVTEYSALITSNSAVKPVLSGHSKRTQKIVFQ